MLPELWLVVDDSPEGQEVAELFTSWGQRFNWPIRILQKENTDARVVPSAYCIGSFEGIDSLRHLAQTDPHKFFR